MVLRLTGGKWKGKQIQVSRGRPTSSLVRQALFDVLPCMQGECILDLFAGSGALTYEALSRGAIKAIVVDHSREACATIRANKRKLSIETSLSIFPVDVDVALKRLLGRIQFKCVFADPPYEYVDKWVRSPHLFDRVGKLLSDGGCFILEHASCSSIPFSEWHGSYQIRSYGETSLSFFSLPFEWQ